MTCSFALALALTLAGCQSQPVKQTEVVPAATPTATVVAEPAEPMSMASFVKLANEGGTMSFGDDSQVYNCDGAACTIDAKAGRVSFSGKATLTEVGNRVKVSTDFARGGNRYDTEYLVTFDAGTCTSRWQSLTPGRDDRVVRHANCSPSLMTATPQE